MANSSSIHEKPLAFILVPGGYFSTNTLEPLVTRLQAAGHKADAMHMPSVGRDRSMSDGGTGPAGLYDDAAYVNKRATKLADEGFDIVLIGNSYGGCVIQEAAKDLSRAERRAAGKAGGALICLVYLASLLIHPGQSISDFRKKMSLPNAEAFEKPEQPDYLDPPPFEVAKLCASELPADIQQKYCSKSDVQASKTRSQPLRYAAFEHIPSTIVIALKDKLVPLKFVQKMADEIISKGCPVTKVELDGDHFIHVSLPDEVTAVVIRAAENARKG